MADQFQNVPYHGCTTKAGAGVGTTTTLTTANTQLFALAGKAYSKAAVTNEATPTLDHITGVAFLPVPILFGSVFLLGRDSGGVLKVAQGQIAASSGTAFSIPPQFPNSSDKAVAYFAYLLVQVGSTGVAWTFGVSNLSGPPTGVQFTFQDIMSLPDRPQLT